MVVRKVAENLGFDGFLDNIVPNDWDFTDKAYGILPQPPLTYIPLVLEFISIYELKRIRNDDTGEVSLDMVFQMFGKPNRVSIRRLNQMFGWDLEALCNELKEKPDEGYNPGAWWARITDGGSEYSPTNSKASEILHLGLRYLHRMFSVSSDAGKQVG